MTAAAASASLSTSGNLLADRRYAYAKAALEEGDITAAEDLVRQCLELAPRFAAAKALLGRALAKLQRPAEAVEALGAALDLAPEDPFGVRIDLAHLGALEPEAAITPGYLRALFDHYAPRFERHLTKDLGYRGPALLADALRRAAGLRVRSPRFRLALDLGCGTGLMAQALRGAVDGIEGVDLSSGMLAKARKARLYDALHEAELVSFLASRAENSADLVIAADVIVYCADLGPVLRESHRVLERGGLLAFTVQAREGEGVTLGEDGRYAHGRLTLEQAAAEAGLRTVLFEEVSTRQERGEDVTGFLLVLER